MDINILWAYHACSIDSLYPMARNMQKNVIKMSKNRKKVGEGRR